MTPSSITNLPEGAKNNITYCSNIMIHGQFTKLRERKHLKLVCKSLLLACETLKHNYCVLATSTPPGQYVEAQTVKMCYTCNTFQSLFAKSLRALHCSHYSSTPHSVMLTGADWHTQDCQSAPVASPTNMCLHRLKYFKNSTVYSEQVLLLRADKADLIYINYIKKEIKTNSHETIWILVAWQARLTVKSTSES